jgi:hypothetical protein
VAFGTAHPEISQNEAQNRFTNTRTKVDWRVEGALQGADSKLVFLVVQCLENTLPWGGHMTLSRFEGNWKRVARGSTPTLTLCSSTTNPAIADSVATSDVHFAHLLSAAKSARRSVATFLTTGR